MYIRRAMGSLGILVLGFGGMFPIQAAPDHLPSIPSSTLLIGSRSPEFLTISTTSEAISLLPEPAQPKTRDWTPIYPSISRDGQTVAYASVKMGEPRDVSVMTYSLTDKKSTKLWDGKVAGSIAISQDGTKVGFFTEAPSTPAANLHVIDLKNGNQRTIVGIGFPRGMLSWSPDNSHIVYESTPTGPDILGIRPTIATLDLATLETTKLAEGQAPAWAPSGEWIAYFDRSGRRCLAVRPDGSGSRVLVELGEAGFLSRRPRTFAEMPVWSPDSAYLLLNELVNEDYGMYIHLLDVKTLKLSTRFKNVRPVVGWGEGR